MRDAAQRVWDRLCDALGLERSELPYDELEALELEQSDELEDLEALDDEDC